MDDAVYRELAILKVNCYRMAQTIRELQKALNSDERFARLEPVRELSQTSLIRDQEKTGPEDQTDPFSVPLEGDYD